MTQQKPSSSLSPKSGGLQEIARKAASDCAQRLLPIFSMDTKYYRDKNEKDIYSFILRALQSVAQPQAERLAIAIKGLETALDELVWTYRPKGYGEIHCKICDCNVSAGEIHSSGCLIPQIDSAYRKASEGVENVDGAKPSDDDPKKKSDAVAQPLEEKIKILEGNKDHPRPESHRDSDT